MQDLIDRTTKRRPADYVSLMSYLAATGQVPKFLVNPDLPEFADGGFRLGPSTGPAGQVEVRGTSPAHVGTLLHELTHAAQVQMEDQRKRGKGGQQFNAAYDKLISNQGASKGAQSLMSRKNPEWPDDYADYRMNGPEPHAFAVGNQSSGIDPSQRAAPHVDTTLAQEFMILLDLATRDLIKPAGGKK